jgi:hypothetical protein
MGIPIIGGAAEAAVLAVEDFVFLNDVSGELTPVDTSSRKNFIETSEVFTNWNNESRQVVTASAGISPSGANDASKLVVSNGIIPQRKIWLDSNSVQLNPDSPFVVGETITFSVHIKKISGQVNTGYLYITTGANDVFAAQQSFTATDDWQRFSVTAVVASTATRVYITGDNDAQLLIWGSQIEQDSRVSNYIPTSGSTVSVATTELGDLSNVWDFDGTDIMLEVDPENEGAFEEATGNLVTNHDFSVDANWNGGDLSGTGWSIANNKASNNGTGGILRQPNAVPLNTQFEVVFTVDDYVTGKLQIKFAPIAQTIAITGNGTYTTFSDGNNSLNGDLQIIPINSFQGSITNISVKEYAITPLNV